MASLDGRGGVHHVLSIKKLDNRAVGGAIQRKP